jgi:hypothetical protein
MLTVSKRTLKILSALVWHIGGIALMIKGCRLLFQAQTLNPNHIWLWLAFVSGFIFGSLKARFLFIKSCKKNLARINALENPRIWQFFRPGFFLFLFLMIIAGKILFQLALNNYPLMIGVVILDFSIAVALLGSSYIFWTQGV